MENFPLASPLAARGRCSLPEEHRQGWSLESTIGHKVWRDKCLPTMAAFNEGDDVASHWCPQVLLPPKYCFIGELASLVSPISVWSAAIISQPISILASPGTLEFVVADIFWSTSTTS
jgi:hypothetical protein